MKFPILKVKDIMTGAVHIVGTNSHDHLYVRRGKLEYMNIQSLASTENGGFDFVGIQEEKKGYSITNCPEIDFLDLEEVIDLAMDHKTKAVKRKIAAYHIMSRKLSKELQECKEETGIKWDSSGELF